MFPTPGEDCFGRTSFPILEIRSFVAPPDLSYQARGSGFPSGMFHEESPEEPQGHNPKPPEANSVLSLNPSAQDMEPSAFPCDLLSNRESRAAASVAHY